MSWLLVKLESDLIKLSSKGAVRLSPIHKCFKHKMADHHEEARVVADVGRFEEMTHQVGGHATAKTSTTCVCACSVRVQLLLKLLVS